jgi:hypothetical protein
MESSMESSMESGMEKTSEEPVEQASGHRYKKIDEADVTQERPSNRIRSKLKDASKVSSAHSCCRTTASTPLALIKTPPYTNTNTNTNTDDVC